MELKEFASLLAKRKMTILLIVIIFLILAFILSIILPFKYASSAQILVIQSSVNPDPYLASRSTEYLSNILARVINSNSFFENVLGSGYFINKNYFGQSVKDQMKKWNKTVSAKALADSGIISLDVYHTDRSQAELIARAVVYTLQTKHGLYHGGGDNVAVKVIDDPITSNRPVQPNLILNFSLALALGLIFAGAYVYFFFEEKYGLKLPVKSAAPVAGIAEIASPEIPVPAPAAPARLEQVIESAADENNFDYDDLDIHEEIARNGSMKNIM